MLFPILNNSEPPALTGIARLAAESEVLREKSRVTYLELPSRSILNHCASRRVPFRWSINPYRGCEFGCKYCYARYTHEFMGMDQPDLFETKIYAKAQAAEILRAELRRRPQGAIAMGTSTDPYQPSERRFGVTRALLEVFAEFRDFDLSITTKSDLIVRDADLLVAVSKRNQLCINFTVTTTDSELARALEPFAPRPDLRLDAARRLAARGLAIGVFTNPVMPGITDSRENLESVAREAAAAGATYFGTGSLFLMPSARQVFLPFLEHSRPHLVRAYRRQFERGAYLPDDYRQRLSLLAAEIREKYNLAPRPTPRPSRPSAQLELF